MSNLLKSKALFGVMIVGMAFAAVMLVGAFALTANAQTTTVTASAFTYSGVMKAGMKGPGISTLQSALNSVQTLQIVVDGSFGPATLSAVKMFQASHNLTADGVVGPMTGNALTSATVGVITIPTGSLPAGCSSTSGYSVTTGVKCNSGSSSLPAGCSSTSGFSSTTGAKCSGGSTSTTLGNDDGDINDFNEVSSADSKFTEGETSEIFAFEAEIDGDVSIDRVDFYLDSTAAGSQSENADDYFDSAVLMVDGEEVATVDVDNFDEDSYGKVDAVTGDSDEYRIRFSGLDLVFNDGDQPEFTLAFEVKNSIDTTDLTETWGVELVSDSIRFVDGKGFSDETGAALEETFSGEGEETAELNVQASSEDPEASVIEVSDTDTTEEVPVFVFEIEEQNNVDVTINDLTVTVTVLSSAGVGTDESLTVTDAYLYEGSKLLGSESVSSGGVVNFENIDLSIDGGDTAELTVKLTFADADEFAAGNTVSVAIVGSTDIDDAEDANGNDEGDMTKSGSATSETHSLREEGIMVVFDDSSYLKTSSDTSGINETVQFTLEFDITAFGDDIYVDKDCGVNSSPASTYVTALAVSLDGDTDGSSTTCTNFDSTGDDDSTSFEVLEGQTEHFTVTILGNGGEGAGAGNATTFKARLESIGYKVGTTGQGDTQYTYNLEDFKSSAVTVYDR